MFAVKMSEYVHGGRIKYKTFKKRKPKFEADFSIKTFAKGEKKAADSVAWSLSTNREKREK